MSNDFDPTNQQGDHTASPSDAHNINGVSQTSKLFFDEQPPEEDQAVRGDAVASPSDPPASGSTQANRQQPSKRWPPDGVAVVTVPEARFHLMREHDIFLKERRVQKLRKDEHKLIGKRVAKKEGGVKVEITLPSLDKWAASDDAQEHKITGDVLVDADDPHLDGLRRVAADKPYDLIIDGVAPNKPATPIETPPDASQEGDEKQAPKNEAKEGYAGKKIVTPYVTLIETPRNAVDREFFEYVKTDAAKYKALFDEERKKLDKTQAAREADNQRFDELLGQQRRDHEEERQELLADLEHFYTAYIKKHTSYAKLEAAYSEALGHLPPGTQLNVNIDVETGTHGLERLPAKIQLKRQLDED